MSERDARTTQGIEEYVEAIWRVAGDGPASTKSLAAHLKVTPASVSGMLRRLAALELVDYRPYGKASLSEQGRRLAEQLVRRHRLSERLLTDILGLPWEQAHAQACKLEHLISGEVEQRLRTVLGAVDTCPHGHPFDATAVDSGRSLGDVTTPSLVRVTAVLDESDSFLRYLSDLGIAPGVELLVRSAEPFSDGALLVEVGGTPRALARRVAEQIRVTPLSPPAAKRSRRAPKQGRAGRAAKPAQQVAIRSRSRGAREAE